MCHRATRFWPYPPRNRLGHNYIGTEHLLIGLLTASGPVAGAFAGLGLPRERAEELIAAELAGHQARKTAN